MGIGVPIKGSKTISKEQLDEVLKEHALWKSDYKQGKRADLSDYNLNGFDLRDVDLSDAVLNRTSFMKSKLCRADLSRAQMNHTVFIAADLTEAIIDGADLYRASFSDADLSGVHAESADFAFCNMRGCIFDEAVLANSVFYRAQLACCVFGKADLSGCELYGANLDGALFILTNMEDAHLIYAENSYEAYFEGANLSRVQFSECEIADEAVEDAKGLYASVACPEEGAFIAWKKCRDDRIVKLMVTENALRAGGHRNECRASEVLVLEICEGGRSCREAVSFMDEEMVFRPGDIVRDENDFDGSLWHDGSGIHFFLSRGDAERFEYDFG